MPISVNTSKQQVQAVVTDDKVTATVSSGFGPTGPQGGSGVVAVTAPITNSGTSTSANIGLSVGTGLQVSSGSLAVTYGASSTSACAGNDARLSDSREWSAATVSQADAEAGTSTSRFAFTPLRVFQAIAAWWNASAAKTKLDGIASGATANATDAQLRDRSTHTGTQLASTISDFTTAVIAAAPPTTNASLLTSGTLDAGRLPASVVQVDESGKISATKLPSYVDDVLEYQNLASMPVVGASGVIYVALDTNKVYRWSGSTYVEVSAGASAWGDITGKPTFAAVATSGAYADLSGTPSPFVLPTATASVLGGVKIGTGVTITDGAISVSTDYAAASDFDQGVKTTDDVEFNTARLTNGDTQAYDYNKTQLKFGYFDGGFSHWVSTTHNAGTTAGNRILFHTNNGTEAGTFPLDAVFGLAIENGGIVVGSEGVTFHDNTKQTTAFTGAIGWSDVTGKPSDFSPSEHKSTHATGGSDALTASDIGAAAASHSHAASAINSGTLDIARIPTGTSSTTVCIGNDSRLSDARTPTSHAHGNITDAGAIGSTSGLLVTTGASGVLGALAQGTAGQVLKVNSGATGVEWGSEEVVEHATAANFPATGSASILYVATDDSRVYRWTGAEYVEVGPVATYQGAFDMKVLHDTVSSTTYTGRAAPGSATSASVWKIRRTVYSGAGAVSSTATATSVKWDDRLTASYS